MKGMIKERLEKIVFIIGLIVIVAVSKSKEILAISFFTIIISELVGWLYGNTSI